jgi:hypothetical protein
LLARLYRHLLDLVIFHGRCVESRREDMQEFRARKIRGKIRAFPGKSSHIKMMNFPPDNTRKFLPPFLQEFQFKARGIRESFK